MRNGMRKDFPPMNDGAGAVQIVEGILESGGGERGKEERGKAGLRSWKLLLTNPTPGEKEMKIDSQRGFVWKS